MKFLILAFSLSLPLTGHSAAYLQAGDAIVVSGNCSRVSEYDKSSLFLSKANLLLTQVLEEEGKLKVLGQTLENGRKIKVSCLLPAKAPSSREEADEFKFYTL